MQSYPSLARYKLAKKLRNWMAVNDRSRNSQGWYHYYVLEGKYLAQLRKEVDESGGISQPIEGR